MEAGATETDSVNHCVPAIVGYANYSIAADAIPPGAYFRPCAGWRRQPSSNATASEGAAMLARGIRTDSGSVASAMLTARLFRGSDFLAALDFRIRFNCGVTISRVELPGSEPRT